MLTFSLRCHATLKRRISTLRLAPDIVIRWPVSVLGNVVANHRWRIVNSSPGQQLVSPPNSERLPLSGSEKLGLPRNRRTHKHVALRGPVACRYAADASHKALLLRPLRL
jgi:hypothetical protein